MSLIETRRDQMFPVLDVAQIETAKRFASGEARSFAPGEGVFDVGERSAPAWLVLEGSIEVVGRDGLNHEVAITSHGVGQISGELRQLTGRAALATGRAGPEGCTALPFDAAHLRALVVGSADVGETIMRAFILRRVGLIQEGGVGSILVGRAGTSDLVRLQGFLGRNVYPYTVLDAAADEEGRAVVERLGVQPEELPLMICPNGTVLKRPTDAEAAACLGITPDLDPQLTYDVAVVGAGPAGLATAVYAASEGLSVLVLDQRAVGGQAGASARIENYLGFPTGISGLALAGRAFNQALKFGAYRAARYLWRKAQGAFDALLAAGIGLDQAAVDREAVTAHQPLGHAAAYHRLEDMEIARAEAAMAVLGKGRMVRHFAEPGRAGRTTGRPGSNGPPRTATGVPSGWRSDRR